MTTRGTAALTIDANTMERVDVSVLLANPARVGDVPAEQVPLLLGTIAAEQSRLAALQAALAGRLAIPTTTGAADTDRLLTIADVAKRLGVPRQYAYELARRQLPAIRFGKYVRVRASDLESWIEAHRD